MPKLLTTVVALALLWASQVTAQDARPSERRVEEMLGRMTLEEKIDLIGGVDEFFVRGVARVGLPRLKMADGPNGVRNFGPATTMPSAPAEVALSPARRDAGGAPRVAVELVNRGPSVALALQAVLRDAAGGARVLPAYYSDNFVSLLPGERRALAVEVPAGAAPGEMVVELKGWNLRQTSAAVRRQGPAGLRGPSLSLNV